MFVFQWNLGNNTKNSIEFVIHSLFFVFFVKHINITNTREYKTQKAFRTLLKGVSHSFIHAFHYKHTFIHLFKYAYSSNNNNNELSEKIHFVI